METIIETERIILRRFCMEDAEAVLDFNSKKEVIQYTGDRLINHLAEAKATITDVWFSDYQKYGYGRFAVVHKADQRVIGFAGLKFDTHIGETDIGYRILPQYWGQGLTSEMVPPILKYGFEQLGLTRIAGLAMLPNIASSKILLKYGFTLEKQAPYPGEATIVNWYAITQEQYLSRFSV